MTNQTEPKDKYKYLIYGAKSKREVNSRANC